MFDDPVQHALVPGGLPGPEVGVEEVGGVVSLLMVSGLFSEPGPEKKKKFCHRNGKGLTVWHVGKVVEFHNSARWLRTELGIRSTLTKRKH